MNHNDLPSGLSCQLSNQQTLNFEYNALEVETRKVIQHYTNEIKTLMRRNSQNIIDIGEKLIEVKHLLGHGKFRNWLHSEFNWSVSTATKFMQVAEQFKCVNFTHLNCPASTLYLIAAPSTPKEARIEVLERAHNGESIGFTKAKEIVSQHRKIKKGAVVTKTTSLKPDQTVNVIEQTPYNTSSISAQESLIKEEAQIETQTLSLKKLPPSIAFEKKQIATNIKDIPENTTQVSTSVENLVTFSHEVLDVVIPEIVISMQNLNPEQLTRIIILAANMGLSESHLSSLITVSQQILKSRCQCCTRMDSSDRFSTK